MKIKLAEALLRRKELQEQVDRIRPINQEGLFEVKGKRQKITEDIDEVVASVPKISMQQVTHCFDTHARALREVDAAIQQANWTTEIDIPDSAMADYVDPYVSDKK